SGALLIAIATAGRVAPRGGTPPAPGGSPAAPDVLHRRRRGISRIAPGRRARPGSPGRHAAWLPHGGAAPPPRAFAHFRRRDRQPFPFFRPSVLSFAPPAFPRAQCAPAFAPARASFPVRARG